jgi:hypothetical protein
MRRLRAATEDEMIALFLRTEITAARFRDGLLRHLADLGLPERLLTDPDLDSAEESRARREVIARHRGYGRNEDMFEDFPAEVRWEWEALTPEEVARVKYIDYSYWNELSGGSRLPADAVPRVRAGIAPFGVSSDWAPALAEAITAGADIPPLILVATHEGGQLVVMEGHARLTAYLLRPESLPPELEVLVGYSPEIVRWGCYGTREVKGER